MKTLKGMLNVILALALLLSLGGSVMVAPAASADTGQGEQEGPVTVSVNAPAEVLPGGNFTATVDIDMVTDFDAANFDVSFDPAVLRLVNVTDGNIGGTAIPVEIWNQLPTDNGTYTIVVNVPGFPGVSGYGFLARLHFLAVGSSGQSSNITLSNGTLASKLAERIPATWVGDSVRLVTADVNPPTVTSTVPSANATGVARSTTIRAAFSEPMNTASAEGAFSTSPSVTGAFSWSGNTMVFTPSALLGLTTTYTVTISTAARDLAGNAMDSDYSWSFTTAGKAAPTVATLAATGITTSSAVLTGNLTGLGDYTSVNVSFLWGTNSSNLTSETTAQSKSGTGTFSADITELQSNTTYYFKAKAAIGTSVVIYGNVLSFTTLQKPTWTVPMTAATATQGSNSNLLFGTNNAATDGLDAGIDVPHPPPAPDATFDAYFLITHPSFPKLDKDLRAPSDTITWTLKVSSTTEDVTLGWDASGIPGGLSAFMNTGTSTINIKTQNSTALSAGTYTISITVSTAVAVNIDLKTGWNMVSLPVTPADSSKSALFPSALVVYTWNPVTKSYASATNLEAAKGYWVAVTANSTVTITGTPVFTWATTVTTGWNMIGSVVSATSFAQPNDNPDGSVMAFAYWWNPVTKSYVYSTTIEPGKGYWAATTQNASLTLSAGSSGTALATEVPLPASLSLPGIQALLWSVSMQAAASTEGSNPNLTFGVDGVATDGLDAGIDVPHPPPAPDATFDAYFLITHPSFPKLDKDFRAPGASVQWTLKATSQTDNITLTWNTSSVPADVMLKLSESGKPDINMKTIGSTTLSSGTLHTLTIRANTITPPAIATANATAVTVSSATLNGILNSLGIDSAGSPYSSVNVSFLWGTNSANLTAETAPQAKTSTGTFSADVSGLQSNTAYYFKAKAVTSDAVVYGSVVSFSTQKVAPAVTTGTATNIATNSATLSGNLTSLGDYLSANVSFLYGTNSSNLTSETTAQSKSGTGTFSADVSGLQSNMTYYFKAKAAIGTSVVVYGNVLSFVTLKVEPAVITDDATSIAPWSAVLSGKLTSLGDYSPVSVSFLWGNNSTSLTQETSVQSKTTTGTFNASLSGLTPATTYYYKAKANTGTGVLVYGNIVSFTTLPRPTYTVPMTAATASQGSNSNLLFGTNNAATDGLDAGIDVPHPPPAPDATFDAYFLITHPSFPRLDKDLRAPSDTITWTLKVSSTTENVTLTWDASSIPMDVVVKLTESGKPDIDMKTTSSTTLSVGSHTLTITAIVSLATRVITNSANNITTNSATLNGSLTSMGMSKSGTPYSSVNVSFLWGTDAANLTAETSLQLMTTTGSFSANISGLQSNTTYYFQAKADAGGGIVVLGSVLSFTTAKVAPTVTTTAASNVGSTNATLNGNLTSRGDYSTVDVSFQWGTTSGSYTSETPAVSVNTTGAFSASLTGLTPSTRYYYRAKAVSNPTVYGDEMSFTTQKALASIAITPDNPTIAQGRGRQLSAIGTYTDNSTENITASVTWSSSNTTVATVSSTGFVQGVQVGVTTITAAQGSISDTTLLTVADKELDLITIAPDNPSVALGKQVQFTANGTYSDGSWANITTNVTWSSSTTAVAIIVAGGTAYTGGLNQTTGTTTIKAELGFVSDTTTITVTAKELDGIAITPVNPTVALGRQVRFTATGTYSNNSTSDITSSVAWTSNSTAVAIITAGGVAYTGGPNQTTGTATIMAALGEKSDATTLTVGPKELDAITVTPLNQMVPLGRSVQFTATGKYSDNSTANVTASANWTSSNTAKATIGLNTGMAKTLEVGSTVIAARIGQIQGSASLYITYPVMVGVEVSTTTPTIPLGRSAQFNAIARFTDNSTSNVTGLVVWTSSNTTVATIGAGGLAKSLARGSTTITGILTLSSGAERGSATLNVTDAVLDRLTITPEKPAVPKGKTVDFKAEAVLTDGTTTDLTATATWTSSNVSIATIQSAGAANPGRAKAESAGSALISATYGVNTANTTIFVQPPVLESISIAERTPAVSFNGTLQLSLMGTFSDNQTRADNLTGAAIWSSSNLSVATFSASIPGLIIARATGTATITASHSGLRDTVTLRVTAPPAVAVKDVTNLTDNAATLNGVLVSRGTASSVNVSFEWGTAPALGTTVLVKTMTATGDFSANLTGLSANTPYYFRAKADGEGTAYSPVQSFRTSTTPPTVVTQAASGVTSTSANLTGRLTSLGTAASAAVSFEWGPTASYGNETSTQNITTANTTFSAVITGLEPSTTYHFRVKAVGDGTSAGADFTFTTDRAVVSILVLPANPAIPAGKTKQLAAWAVYSDQSIVVVTATATWSSNATSVATVNGTGSASGVTVGAAAIQASFGGQSGSTTLNVFAPVVESIDVTPLTQSIATGVKQQFTATVRYSDGSTSNTTPVIWTSSDTGVGAIDSTSGLAVGKGIGTTNITATAAGKQGSALLTVTRPTITSIVVTPSSLVIFLGQSQQYRAVAVYSDDTKSDVTSNVTWSSSNTGVAAISASGLATTQGKAAGTTNITATLDTVPGLATLNVKEATLDKIEVSRALASVAAGKTSQFSANGTYSDGSWADITRLVAWTSSDNSTAKVNAAGLATGLAPGVATIAATLSGKTDNKTLTVTDPVVESGVITPANPTIDFVAGNPPTLQFQASAIYSDTSSRDITKVGVWSSSNTTVATVSSDGVATTVAPGQTTITATYGGQSTASLLTVLPDKVPPRVQLTSPTEGTELEDKLLTVSGGADDTSANVSLIVNGGPPITLALDASGNFNRGVSLNVGSNTVRVDAADGAGNVGTSGTRTVTVDLEKKKPKVTINHPRPGLLTNSPLVEVTGIVSGNATAVILRVNGVAQTVNVTANKFSANVTLLEGENIITANAFPAGNEGDEDYRGTSGTRRVTLDTTPPAVTIIQPASGTVVNSPGVSVNGTVDDPAVRTVLLVLNDTSQLIAVVGGVFYQEVTLQPGSNIIAVVAIDRAGNSSLVSVSVTLDVTTPGITVTAPANNLLTNVAAQTIAGTVDDLSITSATLFIDGKSQSPAIAITPDGSFSHSVTLPRGKTSILEVRITDSAGNTGTSGNISVTVDVTAPDIEIELSDPTNSITITVRSDEGLAAAPIVTVDSTNVTMTSSDVNEWVGTFAPIPPGKYTVVATGTDKAGNTATKKATFTKSKIDVDGVKPTRVNTPLGGTVTLDVETNGAVSGDISVTEHLANPSGNVANPQGGTEAGAFVEIVVSSELRDNLKQIYVTVAYNEADIIARGIDEKTLKLYLWDTSSGTWQVVPGSGVNTEENYIYGMVTHLSKYGGFGNPPPPPAPPTAIGGAPGGGGPTLPGYTLVITLVDTEGKFKVPVTAKSDDEKVSISIAKDVIGKTREGRPLVEISVVKMAAPPEPPKDNKVIGLVYSFGPEGATFSTPVTVTFTYDPAAIPAGVLEKNLVIVRFDAATGKWIVLSDITVDTVNRVISGKTTQFSAFAVMVSARPASFTASGLSVSPSEVEPGKSVSISATITNSGDIAGTQKVTLKVNAETVETRDVTLAGGASQTVSFIVSRTEAGRYTVDVNGQGGSFTVKAAARPAAFTTASLSISPSEVNAGERVTVSVKVTNTGDLSGTYKVTLKVNNVAEATRDVTLAGGSSETVSFTTTKSTAGSYAVAIDGLSGTFTVKEAVVVTPPTPPVTPTPTPAPRNQLPLIIGIVGGAIVIALVIWLVLRARRKAAEKPEEKPEEKAEAKPEEKPEEAPGEQPEEKPEEPQGPQEPR